MPIHPVIHIALALILTGASAMAADLPPSVDRDPALHARLEAAYAAKGPDYVPRTHLMEGGQARYVNRLIEEASPYLIQHAHNPVDWRPWSEETLAEARARDLPIFLSVGYATCHWCHVMEEESFDNVEVATLLNANFIAIKIDREQHPDLDHLFITATQIQQGHAGWPNSVWLTPDGRPFHTGTYMPRGHFMQVLAAISQGWTGGRRAEIEGVADQMADALRKLTQLGSGQSAPLGPGVFAAGVQNLAGMHNDLEGGFSQTQQFPQEGFLLFLLDQWRATGDVEALQMASRTLDAIAAGGIHDHVGGGFHRYTVDPNWRTPHFEKMLYNQALLSRAFIEGWEISGDPAWRRAAERTFAYIARDMTGPEGAFFAAEDADSRDGTGALEEGAFYVWPPEEAAAVIGDPAVVVLLGLDQAATLETGPVAHLDPTISTDFTVLDPMLEALRVARDARARPLRDDKIIAGWNGLMIRALAEGGTAFDTPAYKAQAARAADSVWARLWDGTRLGRFWGKGRARDEGALEDYAWLGLGMLALFDATGEDRWRDRAAVLADAAWTRFGDGQGRLRMAAADGPLGPIYDSADGAVPSGESSALELFTRLSRRTANPEMRARAEALSAALSGAMAQQPLLRPDALSAARVLTSGETGYRRHLAQGKVRVRLSTDRLVVEIADGWHLNAHAPGADWLIGARLDGADTTWPEGRAVKLGFTDEEIRVYDGRLTLDLQDAGQEIAVHLQACSDSICLEPEIARFRLP